MHRTKSSVEIRSCCIVCVYLLSGNSTFNFCYRLFFCLSHRVLSWMTVVELFSVVTVSCVKWCGRSNTCREARMQCSQLPGISLSFSPGVICHCNHWNVYMDMTQLVTVNRKEFCHKMLSRLLNNYYDAD